jgi:hypothetical protein
MKRISTLLSIALLFTVNAFGQYNENFDGGLSSLPTCFTYSNVNAETQSIATSALGSSQLSTPYLTLNASTTVSFNYRLSQKLNGLATRTIEIGTTDANGVFSVIPTATIVLDKNSAASGNSLPVQTFNATFATSGINRFTIRTTGSTGDGQAYIIIDDLLVNAATYYSTSGVCNMAPSVINDDYNASTYTYNGSSVLVNDTDPNVGEVLSNPAIVTNSPDGSVVFNANGSFTFTANAGFVGTTTSFTYIVYDNGYSQASGTATVTINFSTLAPLPIQLLSFSGSLVNNKAQLKWSVDDNETGDRFQIEKSADGRNFSGAGIVFVSTKTGTETYTFHEAVELTTESYYRLKIINKDNSISYSRIIALKNGNANAGNAITLLQNPVRSTAAFNYTTASAGIYDVSIYNAAGMKVYTSKVNCQKGINALSFGMDRYNTGTYVLEVSNDSGRTVTKLMKQ